MCDPGIKVSFSLEDIESHHIDDECNILSANLHLCVFFFCQHFGRVIIFYIVKDRNLVISEAK